MKLGNPLHQVTLFMDIEFYQQNQQFIKTYEIVTQFIRIMLEPMDKGIFKRVKGTRYKQKNPVNSVIKLGDILFVHNHNGKRSAWKLGKIVRLFASKDQNV